MWCKKVEVLMPQTTSGPINNLSEYIHALAARGVHYLHQPGPTLQDIGFFLLPACIIPFCLHWHIVQVFAYIYVIWELGVDKAYISETVFTFVFCSFFSASQFLWIITFYSTQLPGPNYHCREGSELARLPHPNCVLEVLLINCPQGIVYGCGNLIFSSHMIFTLVFALTYQKYGTRRFVKLLSWLVALIQSFLIVASCKHYTVDVIVAWYTVTLVVFYLDKKLPELPDRTNGSSSPLIPMSMRDRDSRTKEENLIFFNGTNGDTVDWRQRIQVNGEIQEKGNTLRVDTAANGLKMMMTGLE